MTYLWTGTLFFGTRNIQGQQEDIKRVNIQQEAKLFHISYGGALSVIALLEV